MGNFRRKLMTFMYGRYGVDELYYGLFAIWAILAIVNMFVGSLALYFICLVSVAFMLFRSFSRDFEKRRRENRFFLKLWNPLKSWIILQKDKIRDRKNARYRRCKHCRVIIKLPNKKGDHTVRCPKCGERFDVHII